MRSDRLSPRLALRHFAAALVTLCGLVVVGTSDARPRTSYDPATSLFSAAYREIAEYYLDPVSLEGLATAGMEGLNTADGSFVVRDVDHSVIFIDHGHEVGRIQAPRGDDADGWASVTSTAIVSARLHSPDLANTSDEALYQRIFDAITARLDRFTRYAGRDQARDQRASRDGFGGIGVTLDYTEATPRISSVVPDGPSARGGLQVNDRIIAIDGIAINRLNQHEVVEHLRGPLDSRVAVTVVRPDRDQPLMFTLSRALIVQPTVTGEADNGIAVLHVEGFNVSTATEVAQEIRRLRSAMGGSLRGAVLDLRDNPGGLLDQAAAVASEFLDGGVIVSTRGRHPTAAQFFPATSEDRLRGIPLAVLVNGGSASASEIVAAALQDNRRGVVIGSSSYGKGTVQMVLRLENSGELTLTWARLVAPSGYLLHGHGVIPTFCTERMVDPVAPPVDQATQVDRILDRGLHPSSDEEAAPRLALSEAEWAKLRGACPADTRSSPLDLKVAERILKQPEIYGRALSLVPDSVAHVGRPTAPALH